MERLDRKFELASEKNRLLKKELSELKETNLELDVIKAQLQGELSNLRYGIPTLETHLTSLDFMIPFRYFVICHFL